MKILQKAYRVWVASMIGEHPIFSPEDLDVCYYETESQAKSHLNISDEKNEHGEKARYIDIKCRRVKSMDKVLYNDEEMFRHQYEQLIVKEARNERLKMLDKNDMYYVQRASSYVGNSVLWWAKDCCGYTCDIDKAHKFTKEDILKDFLNGREDDIIWSASHIDTKIKRHVDAQYLDRKNSV